MGLTQTPSPGDFRLLWCGESFTVTLKLDRPRSGRAVFRTDLTGVWTDIPLAETTPGVFSTTLLLNRVGVFSGKACFFPRGKSLPEWPEGANLRIKVASSATRANNSIYCVFPRQFGSFREVTRRLPLIMDQMGFRIVQTLPPFPIPATYAVMGEYGSPFAATDFLSVDPAMAEFDVSATPLDQFRELVDAVHARGGLFFVDLPANHTGWASTLQTHHPEWFHHAPDGHFVSPGAWGVTWADLVELDYAHEGLREYMADVFLQWCRFGVDGFRCDAGYMIPCEAWQLIVSRVRAEYPETVFLLEGLGGDLKVTDRLMSDADLDWAYSEIFQTYDRGQFEWYLPPAIARAEKYGALVHFAETHDNDRLAKGGTTYARLRVQLAALLSWQGAWGIANGVEWFCREKIDVHRKNGLNWGAAENMVDLIAKLNGILSSEPSFAGAAHLEVVTRGDGNTLAVRRDDELLVLANLDCHHPATIDFDRSHLPALLKGCPDLLTGCVFDASQPIHLRPGEVLCLRLKESPAQKEEAEVSSALFHLVLPRDTQREVVVPAGERVEVQAPGRFRLTLMDEAGRTLSVMSRLYSGLMTAPAYKGNGTRCRRLTVESVLYTLQGVHRARSVFLVPPPADKARLLTALEGAEVRHHPEYRTILSNGAGAASQIRLGWGEIRSQYDALLAANPNPDVPSDRLTVWTRLRIWLQHEGYSVPVDTACVTKVEIDSAGRFAVWSFRVPCGLGKEASFQLEVRSVPNQNALSLRMTRVACGGNEVEGPVRLVFRPDLEWRSFHTTTKAYQGAETAFAHATKLTEEGFVFSPYGESAYFMVKGGEAHLEPEWTYNVGHPEEAARGQEPSGDLFSPVWLSSDLAVGASFEIGCSVFKPVEKSAGCRPDTPIPLAPPQPSSPLDLFIVKRDDLKTVIAGYPWFLDWGRDTFIALRGLIAMGRTSVCLEILKAFAAFEENGTLPNIIHGKTAGNRDTTDAQLWYIRCVQELGKEAASLRPVCESIVSHYISGTPNGIHMDPASALIWSPSHFTWMDTNYPACTPRVGYPVEIQALWISALDFLGRQDLAAQARASLERLFRWEHGYRDCLSAPHGEPAAQAMPEDTIRPNQLFLITLGIARDPSIVRATEELLVPGGIRSLNAGHPLYRGVYAGDEDTSRKPAYHNGTVWTWPFPLYAEALVELGLTSREVALSLLASAVENFNTGCIGHLSENADGDAPHAQKGCTAQAWGDSEFIRVWRKLSGNDIIYG